ncbi:transposase domain containing protein [Trichonephila clavipes]|uniref:Transposase domain containing protein n=1 Tax=Trichonephila clavipes TaxID=2585209 RepID=A0A8X6WKP9_TRICX|nr:transposase domain containing protein [Trichonephila clavipes]
MGQQLRVQRPPIHNILDLRDPCLNIWYDVSPAIYQGLVASMPRRVEAVLRAKVTPAEGNPGKVAVIAYVKVRHERASGWLFLTIHLAGIEEFSESSWDVFFQILFLEDNMSVVGKT